MECLENGGGWYSGDSMDISPWCSTSFQEVVADMYWPIKVLLLLIINDVSRMI